MNSYEKSVLQKLTFTCEHIFLPLNKSPKTDVNCTDMKKLSFKTVLYKRKKTVFKYCENCVH